MDRDLRDRIRKATESSGIEKADFVELLRLVDQHYDRMEATITQSLTATTACSRRPGYRPPTPSHYGDPRARQGIISQFFFQKLRHITDRHLINA
jgi:hypothetical protein